MRRSCPTLLPAFIVLGFLSFLLAGPEYGSGYGPVIPAAQAQGAAKSVGRGAVGARPGAKVLIERGLAALEAKDLPTAGRLLMDAYRLSPRPELLYHLGRVAVGEGRLLEAYDLFRRYLADPAREPDEAAAKLVEQQLAQPMPPGGSIIVLSDPGALVVVDNRAVGTLPLPLPLLLTPGAHSVVLEFPGKRLEAPVQVQLGRTTEVRLSRSSGAVLLSVLPAILLAAAPSGLPPETARLVSEAIDQAARGEQHTLLRAELVLPPEPAAPAAAAGRGCLTRESCQRELAQQHKADFVLQQVSEPLRDPKQPNDAKSGRWKIALRLLRVDVSEPAGAAELTLEQAPPEQLAGRVKEAAAKLLADGLARPRGGVHITTVPAGATLRLGSLPPVAAPLSASLWAGSYELGVSHPGYQNEQRTVVIEEGKTAELPVELQQSAAATLTVPTQAPKPQGRGPRPKWRLALGGTLIGVGVILGAVGLVGVAKDGSCASPPDVEGGNCPQLLNTRPAGAAAFGTGLLVAGTGILLIALPGPKRTAP